MSADVPIEQSPIISNQLESTAKIIRTEVGLLHGGGMLTWNMVALITKDFCSVSLKSTSLGKV